ncbi:endo-1,4-beta-xylanase [Motilibacter aurantiacus]|uniref:endo-1,4-beta-xylanase n=1 Tax=Motilibacter aurantiacus TaxID=2714955 RepID=UPI00140C851B|nr:endo-1,4-beta-xylanase [Motilibacter aurantiacus]NHC46898.1 polysaccharide deacetylase family protein [Motilibacter aurantiacus]
MRRRPLAGLAVASTLATLALAAPPAASAAPPALASTSFETGTDGWGPRGSAQVAITGSLARTGAQSLQVTGRTANWNGPAFNALGLLKPNVTYTIGAYVRLTPGAGSDTVSLTVQRDHGGTSSYDSVANQVTVTDSAWTYVGGAYTFTNSDNTGITAYFESLNAALEFYVDDVAILGEEPATDPGAGGVVNGDCTNGYVALTYDDGPRAGDTTALLNVLAAAKARATFFDVGTNAQADPALVKAQLDGGHWVANHSWTHPHLPTLTEAQMRAELARTQAAITAAGAPAPVLFRPPYGETNATLQGVEASLGLKEVLWDVDSQDWNGATTAQIVARAATLQAGQVILMHDGYATTRAALPQIIAGLNSRGLCPGMISPTTGRAVAPGAVDTPTNPGGGAVTLAGGFEDGTAQGWGPRGPVTTAVTTAAARTGTQSLLTTGRAQDWNGPVLDVTKAVAVGSDTDVSLWLRLAPGTPRTTLRVTVQRTKGSATSYDTVGTVDVTAEGWTRFNQKYQLRGDADSALLYVEGPVGVSFHLDDFAISKAAPIAIQKDIPSLKDVLPFQRVGVAMDTRETAGAPGQLVLKHFDAITPENALKPDQIEPVEGQFNWSTMDRLLDFADRNNLTIYGHVMVWHDQTPAWMFTHPTERGANGGLRPLTNSPADQAILLQRMESHIKGIRDHLLARYPDGNWPIWAFDAVNEVVNDGPGNVDGLRESRWYQVLGEQFIDHAFRITDEYFPNQKLFINDYDTELPGKNDRYYALVNRLLARNVPIDGVSFQTHLFLDRPVSLVERQLERFSELPLTMAISELDVSTSESRAESLPAPTAERDIRAGYYYRDLFDVLRAYSSRIESVTFWGPYDSRSWLRTWPVNRPQESPLPFDDKLQAKQQYWGIVDPSKLGALHQTTTASAGLVAVDGNVDVQWRSRPLTQAVEVDLNTPTFDLRWRRDKLYALVDVTDATNDAADTVEVFVGDQRRVVTRDGGRTNGYYPTVVEQTATGYRAEVALPLAAEPVAGSSIPFDVRVTDTALDWQWSWNDLTGSTTAGAAGHGTLTFIPGIATTDVPKAPRKPVIDGTQDAAWGNAAIVRTEVLVSGDAKGATAKARLMWDAENLYVLADVKDRDTDAGSANAYEQDSLEIFLDRDNAKSPALQDDDAQYRISFDNRASTTGPAAVQGTLTSATTYKGSSYTVEAAISIRSLSPAVGKLLGLDLQVNDATAGKRTSVFTWSDPTGNSYQDASRWGTVRLVG